MYFWIMLYWSYFNCITSLIREIPLPLDKSVGLQIQVCSFPLWFQLKASTNLLYSLGKIKVVGMKSKILPKIDYCFFIYLARLSFVHSIEVFGKCTSFWWGRAAWNSPIVGLERWWFSGHKKWDLPWGFPEEVPGGLAVYLGVELSPAQGFKDLLDDWGCLV